MQLFRVVSVVLVILCECSIMIRSDLMSVFTRDYLVGLNLTEGNIPDLVLDQILDLYAPVSPAVDNDLCRNHSLEYKQAIKDKKLWALFMMEASAIVPDGLMTGNNMQLGNYDGCLQMENIQTASGQFSGQHCLVALTDANSTTKASSNDSITEGILNGKLFVPDLGWAVCIPSSCTPRDLESHLRSTLQGVIGDLTLSVKDNACRSSEYQTVLTAGDWFAIVFFTFFAVIVVLSTTYDLKHSESDSCSPLLISFSLYTNGRKLLTPSTGGPLRALHGIRTLSMTTICLGHVYIHMYFLPAINKRSFERFYDDLPHIGVQNYSLAVDTFFVLGGLLVSYIFLRDKEKGQAFNIPRYYLHRYIRLTPAYAVVVLLTATLLSHAGDGPLWEEVGKFPQDYCVQRWWVNLIYLSNYISPSEQCLDHTWYLSADMQLFVLSPLVLIPLWKWPRLWKLLIGGLISAGILVNLLVVVIVKPHFYPGWEEFFNLWYFPTHMRFAPWVIGVGLGYMLHHAKKTPITLSRRSVVIGWLLCAVFLLGPMFASWSLPTEDKTKIFWLHSVHLAFYKPVFSFGVAWVILACAQGYGGPVNTFLSWSVFEVLGRLTYTVYLVHLCFVTGLNGSLRAPLYISDRNTLMQIVSVVVVSFFAAMLLSLVFEAPALIIEKLLLGKDGQKEKNKKKKADRQIPHEMPNGVTLVNVPNINHTGSV